MKSDLLQLYTDDYIKLVLREQTVFILSRAKPRPSARIFISSDNSVRTMTENLHHATVSVRGIIFNTRNEVLILRRATDAEWELPGGRLATDEDPVEGLKREIAEETMLPVVSTEIVAANSWVNAEGQDRLAIYYHCQSPAQAVELSAEHVEWRWTHPQDVGHRLCDPQAAAVHESTSIKREDSSVRGSPTDP